MKRRGRGHAHDQTVIGGAREGNKCASKGPSRPFEALERCGLFSRFRLGEFPFELIDPILQYQ